MFKLPSSTFATTHKTTNKNPIKTQDQFFARTFNNNNNNDDEDKDNNNNNNNNNNQEWSRIFYESYRLDVYSFDKVYVAENLSKE